MGISGTYDVLLLSLLLPEEQVLQLLPPSLRLKDSLMAVPEEVTSSLTATVQGGLSSDGGHMHPILLQMGYQISTGPGPSWLPKFSFNECKLEVPFIRHPSGKSKESFSFKQTIVFSNPIIKLGSQATGLHSATASFSPPVTPSHAAKGESEIKYTATGYIDATATKSSDSSTISWDLYREMIESWWFGGGTGETIQKFNFDWANAPIPPEPYKVQVEIDLAAFAGAGSNLEKVKVTGKGWRTKVVLSSDSSKIDE